VLTVRTRLYGVRRFDKKLQKNMLLLASCSAHYQIAVVSSIFLVGVKSRQCLRILRGVSESFVGFQTHSLSRVEGITLVNVILIYILATFSSRYFILSPQAISSSSRGRSHHPLDMCPGPRQHFHPTEEMSRVSQLLQTIFVKMQ
jgi:hypothetical protein